MSTSKLQIYVAQRLGQIIDSNKIEENIHPAWLMYKNGRSLELDFYIEELAIAIEVQGMQHVAYVPFFHGDYDGFLEQKKRDESKRRACIDAGISLAYIYARSDVDSVLEKVQEKENCRKDPSLYKMMNGECDTFHGWNASARVLAKIARLMQSLKHITEGGDTVDSPKAQRSLRRRLPSINKTMEKKRIVFDEDIMVALDLLNSLVRSITPPIISHGSKRVRSRGRKLACVQFPLNNFLVFGGEDYHLVSYGDLDDIESYGCKCKGSTQEDCHARDGVCSHIFAAWVYTGHDWIR